MFLHCWGEYLAELHIHFMEALITVSLIACFKSLSDETIFDILPLFIFLTFLFFCFFWISVIVLLFLGGTLSTLNLIFFHSSIFYFFLLFFSCIIFLSSLPKLLSSSNVFFLLFPYSYCLTPLIYYKKILVVFYYLKWNKLASLIKKENKYIHYYFTIIFKYQRKIKN